VIEVNGCPVRFEYIEREKIDLRFSTLYTPNSLSGMFYISGYPVAYGNILVNKSDKTIDILAIEVFNQKVGLGDIITRYLKKCAGYFKLERLRGVCYLYDVKRFL